MTTAAVTGGLDLSASGGGGRRSRKRRLSDRGSPAPSPCSADAPGEAEGDSPASPALHLHQSSGLSLAGDCEEGAREDEYEEGGSEGGQSATGNSGSGGGGSKMDDERLKAFNLFVRFFVDENLDRMVPISKQPKEKLSGILEACDRQFPEFSDRARKRVRTYLKACRRNGRKNGGLPQELPRTTPAHLTSATAEGILEKALAGERELQAQLHPARLEQAGMPQAQQLSRPDRPAEQQRVAEAAAATARPAKQAKATAAAPAISKDASAAPAATRAPPTASPMVPQGQEASVAAASLLMGLPHGALPLTSVAAAAAAGLMPPFAAFATPFLPLHLAASRPLAATAAAATNTAGPFGGFIGGFGARPWDPRERDLDWPAFEALFRAQMSQAGGMDGTAVTAPR